MNKLRPRSLEVQELQSFLLGLPPWESQAFSCAWTKIPEAHEFIGLIEKFQPIIIADVGDFHIFLDGSFLPDKKIGAWAFTVLLRSSTGDYFRWGLHRPEVARYKE